MLLSISQMANTSIQEKKHQHHRCVSQKLIFPSGEGAFRTTRPAQILAVRKGYGDTGQLLERLLEGEVPGHSPHAPVMDYSLSGHLQLEKSGPVAADWVKTHPWKSGSFLADGKRDEIPIVLASAKLPLMLRPAHDWDCKQKLERRAYG